MHPGAQRVLVSRIHRVRRSLRRSLNQRLQGHGACALVRRRLKSGNTSSLCVHAHKETSQDPCAARRESYTHCFQQQRSAHLRRIEPAEHGLSVNTVPAVHDQTAGAQLEISIATRIAPHPQVDCTPIE